MVDKIVFNVDYVVFFFNENEQKYISPIYKNVK